MTIANALRRLLALAAGLIVLWAFFDVGVRQWREWHPADNRVHLTVLHWGDHTEDAIVKQLTDQFEQEHPEIAIERINPGSADYDSKLKTMLAAGTPPDVFYFRTDMLPELAGINLIRPVDDLVAQEQQKTGGKFLDDYYPILLDEFRYDATAAPPHHGSGPLYGLPKDFTTAVFYVNVDLFKAAGIAVPYEGWTWDEFEADMREITALTGRSGYENRKIHGGFFQLWGDTIENIVWSYGGHLFGPGGIRDITLDSPAVQQALDMIYRLRITDQTVYNPTGIAKEGGQEFVSGDIGCLGPIGRWQYPPFKNITGFKWDVVPIPYKEKKYASSAIFLTAWSMSQGTKHPKECFELMKFLSGKAGTGMQSRLGLSIPPLKSVANGPDFLAPPGFPPVHNQVFLDAVPLMKITEAPPQQEWSEIFNSRITKSISLGQESPQQSCQTIKTVWFDELNSPLRQHGWPPMNWHLVLGLTAAALVTLLTLLWWRARKEKLGFIDRAQERAGWRFILPWIIGFLTLTLGPMVLSFLLSFSQWSGLRPLGYANSVGPENYKQLLLRDPTFIKSLQVTAYYVVLAVPTVQVAALAVALLMNLKIRGITFFRTIYFVPSVISGAALSLLWLQIFNDQYGILNAVLRHLLHPLTMHYPAISPPNWFGQDARTWAIPGFVIMNLWGVGGGMIIYLAGLKGIPASLYEAATIDGAGPLRRLWNITLPMLSPLIFYNLVMGIIGSFQIFTQAYMITGPGPDNSTLFYVLNLYLNAFSFYKMGYASAMAWVLFIVVLLLTLAVFRTSKNLVYYEGLKS